MNIIQNISYQFFATIIIALISTFVLLFIARFTSVEQFGYYNYLFNIGSIFLILFQGGFTILLFREKVSQSSALFTSHKIISFAICHCMSLLLIILICITVLPLTNKLSWCYLFICFSLLAITNFISSYIKGGGKFIKEANWQLLCRFSSALFIVLYVYWFNENIELAYLGWAIGLFIALLFIYPIWLNIHFTLGLSTEIYKQVFFLLLIEIATAIYFRIDVIFLKLLDSDMAAGYYSASYRIVEAIILLLYPIAQIYFFQLRKLWNNKIRFKQSFHQLLLYSILVALLIIMICSIFNQQITYILYGPDYSQSSDLLVWLSISLIFIVPCYVLTQSAIALGKEKAYAFIAIFIAAINCLLNFWLIPDYSYFGAAWSTIITEALLMILLYIYIHRLLNDNLYAQTKLNTSP